jgi:hypothetical protein
VKDDWLQRLIAMGLAAGIGKRQLLEDYYFDEIFDVLSCRFERGGQGEKAVDVDSFF